MFEDLQDTRVNRRKRKQEDAELDITPMIDVTFLLLIFFIVASRMDPQNVVDMPTAKHGSTVAEKNACVLVVAKGSGEEPIIYLGKSKDPANEVKGTDEEKDAKIEAYVDEELHASTPKIAVLIKAEQGIKFRYIDQVSKAASRAMDPETRLHIGIIERQ